MFTELRLGTRWYHFLTTSVSALKHRRVGPEHLGSLPFQYRSWSNGCVRMEELVIESGKGYKRAVEGLWRYPMCIKQGVHVIAVMLVVRAVLSKDIESRNADTDGNKHASLGPLLATGAARRPHPGSSSKISSQRHSRARCCNQPFHVSLLLRSRLRQQIRGIGREKYQVSHRCGMGERVALGN